MKGQGQHTLSPSRYFYRFRQKKRHSREWANDNPENPVCHNWALSRQSFPSASLRARLPLRFWWPSGSDSSSVVTCLDRSDLQ
jgi:hypothetical protein